MQPNDDEPVDADGNLPGHLPHVGPLREASRLVVRELGMLEDTFAPANVTHSEVHALLELSRRGVANVGELADALRLDKSVVSRIAGRLGERRLVRAATGEGDRRAKPLTLAAAGRRLVERIHRNAGAQVDAALRELEPDERDAVVHGMALYAKALRRARAARAIAIRPLTPADDPAVARVIRDVMTEHGASGPGFAIHDPEVAHMSEAYRPDADPPSAYFVLDHLGEVVGGAGFGALVGGDPGVCELRKMYLRPSTRGLGLGRRLLLHVVEAARVAGYRRCYLETMATMHRARALYASAGFAPLPGPEGATGHFGCDSWYARDL